MEKACLKVKPLGRKAEVRVGKSKPVTEIEPLNPAIPEACCPETSQFHESMKPPFCLHLIDLDVCPFQLAGSSLTNSLSEVP